MMYSANSAALLLTLRNFCPHNYTKHCISEIIISEIQIFWGVEETNSKHHLKYHFRLQVLGKMEINTSTLLSTESNYKICTECMDSY